MQAVTLTFSAMGLVPGTYQAQLDLSHNTPYAIPRLPVTLTVTYGDLLYLPLVKK